MGQQRTSISTPPTRWALPRMERPSPQNTTKQLNSWRDTGPLCQRCRRSNMSDSRLPCVRLLGRGMLTVSALSSWLAAGTLWTHVLQAKQPSWLLLEARADPSRVDLSGRTAGDIAVAWNQDACAEILRLGAQGELNAVGLEENPPPHVQITA